MYKTKTSKNYFAIVDATTNDVVAENLGIFPREARDYFIDLAADGKVDVKVTKCFKAKFRYQFYSRAKRKFFAESVNRFSDQSMALAECGKILEYFAE